MLAALDDMSWRRFMVLLRGLSPNSATVVKLSSMRSFGKKKVNVVEGPVAANAAFDALFAEPPKPAPVTG